eukprot:539938-Rhodomonas_salina.2
MPRDQCLCPGLTQFPSIEPAVVLRADMRCDAMSMRRNAEHRDKRCVMEIKHTSSTTPCRTGPESEHAWSLLFLFRVAPGRFDPERERPLRAVSRDRNQTHGPNEAARVEQVDERLWSSASVNLGLVSDPSISLTRRG